MQKSDSKQKLRGRTGVVDTKFENVQWSLLDSVSQSSADTDRCIYKGMGCDMSRDINRESMVKGGTAVTHSTFELQQTKIFESSSFSNRQHRCTTLPSNVTKIKQRNLAASLETPDHNYCRIPSKFFECGSRSVCIKTVSPTTLVHCLETWPFQSGDRYPTTDLGQSITIFISHILPYSTSLEESDLQPHRKYVVCHTNLAVSYLIPPSTRNVYISSTATSKERKVNKPTRISSSCYCKQNIMASSVEHIRERLLKKWVSEIAAKLITKTKWEASNFTKVHSQITIRPG